MRGKTAMRPAARATCSKRRRGSFIDILAAWADRVTSIVADATADSPRIEPLLSTVMRGLDPRIHLLAKRMDCRVKPGNDNRFNMTRNRYSTTNVDYCPPQRPSLSSLHSSLTW